MGNEGKKVKGTVKWFDGRKGFGFITPEDNPEKDVFVHYSDIEGQEGFRNLKDGQTVEYELGKNEKGEKAIKVRTVA